VDKLDKPAACPLATGATTSKGSIDQAAALSCATRVVAGSSIARASRTDRAISTCLHIDIVDLLKPLVEGKTVEARIVRKVVTQIFKS
jgi:hypothetical protein